MLDALATAIETLSIGVDGAELTAAIAQRDRLEAKITLTAAEFDAAELWGLDGSVSMAAWLRTHTGQTPRQARRMERTGRRLRQLPGVAAARTNGALSSGHVDAIVATLSDRTSALFADQETTILVTLAHHDVRDAASYLQQWQALALAYLDSLDSLDDTPPEPEPPARRVHLSPRARVASAGVYQPTSTRLAQTAATTSTPAIRRTVRKIRTCSPNCSSLIRPWSTASRSAEGIARHATQHSAGTRRRTNNASPTSRILADWDR